MKIIYALLLCSLAAAQVRTRDVQIAGEINGTVTVVEGGKTEVFPLKGRLVVSGDLQIPDIVTEPPPEPEPEPPPAASPFTDKGSIGTAASTTPSDVLVMRTEAPLAVGDFAVLLIASDNLTVADGSHGEVTGALLDGFAFAPATEYTNGAPVRQGVTDSVLTLKVAKAIPLGSILTVKFAKPITAKAALLHGFSGGIGKLVGAAGLPNDGSLPGEMTLTVPHTLAIRAIAQENRNPNLVATQDGWTRMVDSVANPGIADSSAGVSVIGQFRIGAGASVTSNPGGTPHRADYASVLVAFE